MKRLATIFAIAGVVVSSVAFVARAAAAPPAGPTVVMTGHEKYGPAPATFPKGSMVAVLSGDSSKAGSQYALRLKLPAGAKIPAHTHGDTEDVTVISGTLMVGVGKKFDAAHLAPLTTGSYVSIPAGTPHYGMAKGMTVVQVNGVGPSSMTIIK
jgi:quercetin dioxygenase-like cupin family protein